MSLKKASSKKGKHPRTRSSKILRKRRLKTKKYRKSGWKLEYPSIFIEINEFPYIIKKT